MDIKDGPKEPSDRTALAPETDPNHVSGLDIHLLLGVRMMMLWILSAGIIQLLAAVLAALPPAPGEPWLLRWLRTGGEHPVRSTLALGLALQALALPRPLGRA